MERVPFGGDLRSVVYVPLVHAVENVSVQFVF